MKERKKMNEKGGIEIEDKRKTGKGSANRFARRINSASQ